MVAHNSTKESQILATADTYKNDYHLLQKLCW